MIKKKRAKTMRNYILCDCKWKSISTNLFQINKGIKKHVNTSVKFIVRAKMVMDRIPSNSIERIATI